MDKSKAMERLNAIEREGAGMVAEKQFFTIEETASVLRVSNMTIYRKTKAGLIPSVKISNRVLVPTVYIQSLIDMAIVNAKVTPAIV